MEDLKTISEVQLLMLAKSELVSRIKKENDNHRDYIEKMGTPSVHIVKRLRLYNEQLSEILDRLAELK